MAKKRKKHNLAGLDFQGLIDLRNQVDEALTGYKKHPLAPIGIARLPMTMLATAREEDDR